MKKYWPHVCAVLLLLNLWMWAWSNGPLRVLGFGPDEPREPERVQEQVMPEALQLQPRQSPP